MKLDLGVRAAAILLATTAITWVASPVFSKEVEVIHWLTTGSESKAIQHVADAVNALGTKWVEIVPPDGFAGANALFTSRLSGGDPVGAMFASIGKDAITLGAQGVLRDVRPFVEKENLIATVPKFAIDVATGPNGEIYGVPLTFETVNFIWYSIPALKKAGVEAPKSWQQLIDDAPKYKDAGIIPFAVGVQAWQIGILHFSVMASTLGAEDYLKLYKDKDATVAVSDGVIESFRIMRALSELADEGATNRSWNDTLGLVADGKAGVFMMGSWAGGELDSMKKVYGTDWGCAIAGGDTWVVGSTGFMMPKLADEAGQDDFIRALLDPKVQTAFAIDKGSIPARTDADTSALSDCSKMVATGMSEGRGVPGADALLSGDANGQIFDLLMNFWADRSVTPEAAAAQFADIVTKDL
jgi:glucose/mannose transport system substrate-binding protein